MLAHVAPLLGLAMTATAATLAIDTPSSVVQCEPVYISWAASNQPVNISVIPGNLNIIGGIVRPLEEIGTFNTGTTFFNPTRWIANIPAGTLIAFQIVDSLHENEHSGAVTVQNSSDTSCLGCGVSSSASSLTASSSVTSIAASSSASSITASPTSAVSEASGTTTPANSTSTTT